MQAIIISCSSERGFRRAGVFHPHGRKTWMPGDLTEQQVEQIMQEAQRPNSPLTVMIADAALALLRPFLRVSETQAQAALAELLPPESIKGEGGEKKPAKKENKS
ncbi:HI1506-related protein [Candidatus Electronema sp. JM]|uniref:HI1506-related protein n=1 Tax=Candidatus Electronema sp. JM TaxID=3401571 RepID=UPI003AA97A96